VISFLEDVRRRWHDPMAWLPKHLIHLYCEREALRLLRRTGFER
jgi:hypothetical protein